MVSYSGLAVDYPRGQPNLLDVLRETAQTFTPYPDDECPSRVNLEIIPPDVIREDVKELLETTRVLLLDNFETVSPANQRDILQFFGSLRGPTQTLISMLLPAKYSYRMIDLLKQEGVW